MKSRLATELDLRLPLRGGLEAQAWLRSKLKYRNIPIILISTPEMVTMPAKLGLGRCCSRRPEESDEADVPGELELKVLTERGAEAGHSFRRRECQVVGNVRSWGMSGRRGSPLRCLPT